MAIELTKQEIADIVPSLQRYFREERGEELGELQAKLLLDYLLKEIGPYAYNRGVRDAEKFFRAKVEDLSATCFEDELAYWARKRK